MKKIYLSSKDHLRKDARELFEKYRHLANQYGFELMSMPEDYFELTLDTLRAQKLAKEKLELIKQCDIMIVDTNDFRCDNEPFGESSLEFGIATGLKKDCYCYMSDTRTHYQRYKGKTHFNSEGRPVDENEGWFENDAMNLMLYYSAIKVIQGDFEDCLKAIEE